MKAFLAVLLVFVSFLAKAGGSFDGTPPDTTFKYDRYFTSFGYGVSFPRYKVLNSVIDNYNNTRPNIKRKMPNIIDTHGFDISIGSMGKGYILEYGYSQRTRGMYGIDSIQGFTEQRNIRIASYIMSMGISAKVKGFKRFTLYAGGAVTGGFEVQSTGAFRSYDTFKQPLKRTDSSFLLGITASAQLHYRLDKAGRFGVMAKPYFFAEFLECYYGDLNKTINPLTYKNNDNNNLYGFSHMLGLELKVFVVI
ncbi:MAG: hypothetical protein M0D57_19040 [Sphingobacteriales bacterium JAD_PAG50586_3]|nr:MAG: hypothetical protein M0D57_19040 [Sphingobacteriales bacterium JAD_PAG50586_3]